MRASVKRVEFVLLLFTLCIVGLGLTWRARVGWIQNTLPAGTVEYKEAFSPKDQVIRASRNASLLIVQYTDGDTYSALLDLTGPINEAYAERWGYDYELFIGLMIQAEIPSDGNNTAKVPRSRATYNKVMILDKVLNDVRYKRYDKLLILDSDALMYDFSRDITTLLPNNRMMLGHKVKRNESDMAWNINIGVTMWNLRHVATMPVCCAWKKACIHRIIRHPTLHDCDQTPLQAIMKDIPELHRRELIYAVPDELGYARGQLVRHFIRPDASNWTDYVDTMPMRIAKIESTITEICSRTYMVSSAPHICNKYINYSDQVPTNG